MKKFLLSFAALIIFCFCADAQKVAYIDTCLLYTSQGKRYYFRDITWTGNSEYTEDQLNSILRIEKGSIYDVVTMEKRLFGGDKENDLTISKLYLSLIHI